MTIFLMGKQRSGSGVVCPAAATLTGTSGHDDGRGEGKTERETRGVYSPSQLGRRWCREVPPQRRAERQRQRHWWRRGGVREREGVGWGGEVREREGAVEYERGRE
jgi:hypothetical protein